MLPPHRELRPRNTRHESKHTQPQHMSGHPHVHIHRTHMDSNRGQSWTTDATEVYNKRMAAYQRGSRSRGNKILANKAWASYVRWHCNEGYTHNDTLLITEADPRAATQQSHWHWEKMYTHQRISVLDQHECWHWPDCEAVFYRSWISVYTAAWSSATPWYTMQAIRGSWCWQIHG